MSQHIRVWYLSHCRALNTQVILPAQMYNRRLSHTQSMDVDEDSDTKL